MPPNDCIICRKHLNEINPPGGIIHESRYCVVTHSLIPDGEEETYLGIFFIETKRHVPAFEDLSDEEAQDVGLLISRTSRALKTVTQAEHIYMFRFGHHVDHFHVWVVPRYPGTPREYWGLKVDEWEEAPRGGIDHIEELCAKVQIELESSQVE
jgi:diadenosine tetraphosphate (Ap4A) HIT family hydrolase